MPILTPADPVLFTDTELSDHLGDAAVTPERAAAAERLVWGWLKPVLGLEARPNPVPAEVFSWAIELGGIAHENPAGLSSYELGAERYGFSAERRDEILRQAATGGHAATPLSPRGSFPKAACYPDAARSW